MAITLRADTGSALTHNQVDTNFTSFFYSSSISGTTLTLFMTGSTALGISAASSSITLPGGTLWTASAADINRNGNVTVTGSFKQGSAGIVATGENAHAEGNVTQAIGWHSHAEGRQTQARGSGSHAEGYLTVATGSYSHAEGVASQAKGTYSHAEGNANIATGVSSHAEGLTTEAVGEGSHAEGIATSAQGYGSHAEGFNTVALGDYSHAQGTGTEASGSYSHAQGMNNVTVGIGSHAQGSDTIATGEGSHTEGYVTRTIGAYSHAEGYFTSASGDYSHAEGYNTKAIAQGAHSEGQGTLASASYSHAEGQDSQAKGIGSHAEGYNCFAIGQASHAEGYQTQTDGAYSHTEGVWTKAAGWGQTVVGHWNLENSSTGSFIIGNGTSSTRSNLVFASGSTFQVSGSLNVSGSISIANGFDFTAYGNKQFNYGMFFHTASISVANGTSGSALLSTTSTAAGVSIVSGSRITVANPGYYNIQFSAQLSQGSGAANYYLWFKKNGSNLANSNSIKTLATSTNQLMTVDIIDYASNAGDYYEIAHQSDNANSTILYSAAAGNIPATPSLIVTVQQVR